MNLFISSETLARGLGNNYFTKHSTELKVRSFLTLSENVSLVKVKSIQFIPQRQKSLNFNASGNYKSDDKRCQFRSYRTLMAT